MRLVSQARLDGVNEAGAPKFTYEELPLSVRTKLSLSHPEHPNGPTIPLPLPLPLPLSPEQLNANKRGWHEVILEGKVAVIGLSTLAAWGLMYDPVNGLV